MPSIVVSVIAIIHFQNKFLLVKRQKDDELFPSHWQNLGGKLETGERIESALKREIQEEIGISIKNTYPQFVLSYSWLKGENEPVRLGLVFLFNLQKLPKRIKLCSELEDFGWFTLEEIKKLKTISPTSPTGTLNQLKAARKLIKAI